MSESLIGKKVWRFDVNRRTYRPDGKGGPIYREHWVALPVFGETNRSWLAGPSFRPYKIPKTGPHPGFALTEQEVADDCWAHEHRHNVLQIVESKMRDDLEFLKKMAEMVGYVPEAD